MVNFLVHPHELLGKAMTVKGFTEMVDDQKISLENLNDVAAEIATEWTQDWDEGEGFGSSDMTYMVRHFIADVIAYHGDENKHDVVFNPTLQVTKK